MWTKTVWSRILSRFQPRTRICLVGALLLLAGFAGWQVYMDWRHQSLATTLNRLGCSADFHRLVTVPGASPLVQFQDWWTRWTARRIRYVTFRSRDKRQIREAIAVVKQLGSVDSVASHETGIELQQVDELLSSIRINSLFIASEVLPRTRIPAFNRQPLRWLCVARTQFSNPAIEDLPDSLTYFDATRTRVTDEGLEGFRRLRRLKTLILRRTPTTQAAIDQLAQQMPWCQIHWEPMVKH